MKGAWTLLVFSLFLFLFSSAAQAQLSTTICTGGTAILTATTNNGVGCTITWEQRPIARVPLDWCLPQALP